MEPWPDPEKSNWALILGLHCGNESMSVLHRPGVGEVGSWWSFWILPLTSLGFMGCGLNILGKHTHGIACLLLLKLFLVLFGKQYAPQT